MGRQWETNVKEISMPSKTVIIVPRSYAQWWYARGYYCTFYVDDAVMCWVFADRAAFYYTSYIPSAAIRVYTTRLSTLRVGPASKRSYPANYHYTCLMAPALDK